MFFFSHAMLSMLTFTVKVNFSLSEILSCSSELKTRYFVSEFLLAVIQLACNAKFANIGLFSRNVSFSLGEFRMCFVPMKGAVG